MIKVLTTAVIVAMSMLLIQVYFTSSSQKQLKEVQSVCDSLQTRVLQVENFADSIKSELFVYETQLNRYYIALEMLENENYAAASEFNKRLSMTE
jgi:hypothetical protein